MLSVSLKHSNPIYFRGNLIQSSNISDEKGIEKEYIHESDFMRNFETLEYTRDYIIENFPQGTHIAEFGCSEGQKPYSLMVLLDDYNKDKKYKITGYDISQNVVDSAKEGVYLLSQNVGNEGILFENFKPDKKLRDYKEIDRLFTKENAESLRNKFFEYFEEFYTNKYNQMSEKTVRIKPEKVQGLVDFKVGDINNINNILEPKKTGVVIFQNAIYHILGSRNYDTYEHISVEPAKKIFEKINKILPENGLFILGRLSKDHLYEPEFENQTRLLYQNNQRIRVCDSLKLHQALRDSGFEPVFYEKVPGFHPYRAFNDVHLPSVWKKVSHLK